MRTYWINFIKCHANETRATYLQFVRINLPDANLTIVTTCYQCSLITGEENARNAVCRWSFSPKYNRYY